MGKPEGLWFGRERSRCFGMLHQPEVASNRGVVFCGALGFEGLLTCRAFRHIADGLTVRGQWALRFDYDGEGDSDGGAWEPARLDAWISSIDAAVGVLHARGVTDIQLVGFRMGASLASLYATTNPGISGLVLWSPCVRGSSYVRELRALSRLSNVARPEQHTRVADRFPDDSLEVAGFEFAGETLRDLGGIDLLAAPAPISPPAVLVVDRDDAPPSDGLVSKFADAGSQVDHYLMSGYEDFVTDGEENAVLPWPTLRHIEIWLDGARPAVAAPAVREAGAQTAVESTKLAVDDPTAGRFLPPEPARDDVVEEAVWVDGRFFAVISSPAGGAPIRRASIVLSNTGSNNRVGPGRLYVGLARHWASLGFTVVRVDIGGTGDSIDVDPPTENQPLAPIRTDELHDVITWVRRWTGFDQVVVSGMCSGAYHAFHVAINGLDVDHLMLVNPGLFYLGAGQTVESSEEVALHSAYALTRGVTSGRQWKVALRDREVLLRGLKSARWLLSRSALSGYRVFAAGYVRSAARRMGLPVKAASALARDLEDMISRGVKVLIVFAAGESSAAYLRTFGGPAVEALKDGDRLEIIDVDGGDHNFSPPGSRQQLIEMLTEYLQSEYTLPLELPRDEVVVPQSRDAQG